MGPCSPIQGSHSLSRYGDWQGANLTLGITRDTPAWCREGFTDLSRIDNQDRSWPGQCDLPDKELRSEVLLLTRMCQGAGRFRRPLHVAMQLGLALHPPQAGAWRIVSEDSENCRLVRPT